MASTINVILDVILILASIWMLMSIRGVGGLMGRTLSFIVIGAVILGAAHLIATLTTGMFVVAQADGTTLNLDGVIHRVIVLVGFVFLALGFRQLRAMK